MNAMASAYVQVTHGAVDRLHPLLQQIFAPYELAGSGIVEQAPDLALNQSAASSLALILHELATNTAKYGALSQAAQVLFKIKCTSDDAMLFTWHEVCETHASKPPSTEGFGTCLGTCQRL